MDYFDFTKKSDLLEEFGVWCNEHLKTQHARDVYTLQDCLLEFLFNRNLTSNELLDIINDTRLDLIYNKDDLNNSIEYCIKKYYDDKLYNYICFDDDFKKMFIIKILQFSKIKATSGLFDYLSDFNDFDENDIQAYCEVNND